jgi:hypothetical protein
VWERRRNTSDAENGTDINMKTTWLVVPLTLVVVGSIYSQTVGDQSRDSLIYRLTHFRDLDDATALNAFDTAFKQVVAGDSVLLSDFFDVSFISDGYISESVGTALGTVLLVKTNMFLNMLSLRPAKQQRHIAIMAFYMDGGGMSPKDFAKARKLLNEFKSDKRVKVSTAAANCLSAMTYVRNLLETAK